MAWCRELGAEPYLCLNMGTGTLEDALGWLEYCNRYRHYQFQSRISLILPSSSNTYYANLRRKNGNEEPYHVKVSSIPNLRIAKTTQLCVCSTGR